MSNANAYGSAFCAWAMEQAALLRAGRLADADTGSVAEEIESMRRNERRELVNRLTVLLTHLLKRQVQPVLRSNSRRLTVFEHRGQFAEHLKDNFSLKRIFPDGFATAYRSTWLGAQEETGLPEKAFSAVCPWNREQVMAEGLLPG